MTYTSKHWEQRSDELVDSMRECIASAVKWCVLTLRDEPLEQLIDMLQTSAKYFKLAELDILSELIRGPWGQENLSTLKESPEEGDENLSIMLLVAYCDAQLTQLLDDLHTQDRGPAAREIFRESFDIH